MSTSRATNTRMFLFCSLAALALGLQQQQQQVLAAPNLTNLPGGQTTAAALASASDGMSRYLAPNGPIQPAITAIGGLPVRGAELANRGITSISSGLNRGAQSMSRSAGQNGQIRMPGMQALESSMPASFARLGQGLQSAIQSKNRFIMGQAEAAVSAGDRLRNMMQQGLQVRSSGGGHSMGGGGMEHMVGQAQDAMMKGGEELKAQLQKSLSGHMDRMQAMQGMGSNMGQQMQGLGRTLGEGLQGAAGHLQMTGDKLMNQMQSNHSQNRQAMSGILGSMHGSMENMGSSMQKNLQGLQRHAQNAAQQVSSHLQQAVQGPLNMIQSLGSNLGSMMKGGASHGSGGGSSSGGRY